MALRHRSSECSTADERWIYFPRHNNGFISQTTFIGNGDSRKSYLRHGSHVFDKPQYWLHSNETTVTESLAEVVMKDLEVKELHEGI